MVFIFNVIGHIRIELIAAGSNRSLTTLILASLPFRFKAGASGAMPGVIASQHHHRSTTKTTQKSFKSRFTSKNDLREQSRGRAEQEKRGHRKTQHQQVMSKFDRKNHAKQMRLQKHKQHEEITGIFKGKDAAPRIVAVVPLSDDIVTSSAIAAINSSMDVEEEVPAEGGYLTQVDRFKQRVQYIPVHKDLFAALDACRVADYVLFVLSATQEVDEAGELILRSVEGQGISNVYVTVQGTETIEHLKKRQQTIASLESFIRHFFPAIERLYSLDNRQECLHVIRSLCTTTPKGIRWREDRSWLYVEDLAWSPLGDSTNDQRVGGLSVTGVVRGQSLKADRLAHLGDWGDFQIARVSAAPRPQSRKGKENLMALDGSNAGGVIDQPSAEQDTLEELAPEEVVMDDADDVPSLVSAHPKGVLLDDQHYYSDVDADEEEAKPKRIPKGTSKYQAAWYLGEDSDSGSDMEDIDAWEQETGASEPQQASMGDDTGDVAGPSTIVDDNEAMSEYPESEMFIDPSPEEQAEADELAEYRAKRRKTEAEEDREFPDEIELHPHVLAHERLSKYRGLKNLKTSQWNTEADRLHRPDEWNRLLDISDYRAAKSKVMRESLTGGVKPGTRVRVDLRDVPIALKDQYDSKKPLAMYQLLRHEHKRTCVNVSIHLDSEAPQPIKAKEELIVQIGPRRFVVNPLFSHLGATPNDVHKFERYLHPGRTAVASFVAPVIWGSVPALFFQKSSKPNETGEVAMDTSDASTPGLKLVGHGTTLPPSTSRIIAKRAVLTGQPYRIHKKLVTIRYMFFNAEDVAWFKALQLWTNRGRQGTIKESLGTHGYFKAVFDNRINSQDAVGISLYKRVWPRTASAFRP